MAGPARIGIDIGGTFTDVVYGDGRGGTLQHVKTLTTPDDITEGILAGIDKVDAEVAELRFFLHGTTVALNAFLQGRTPKVGLITTAGFRDVLEIMRTNRPDMYDLQQVKPPPLVPRHLRREISARVDYAGAELSPVVEAEVNAIAAELVEAGVRDVAVCLMHAYASPDHERAVKEILTSSGHALNVCISSDLTREWREFERTSTTVVNAATVSIMTEYIRRLHSLLAARGFDAELLIMQSSSGVMAAEDATRRPAATLMSGPVGGVAGAEAVARTLDEPHVVTLDIGGTSADVAIIDHGHAVHTPQAELDRWPILMPMVDIRSIGAGGGSIARVDSQGRLHVGPESAGASPGPACYARGGTHATVTDANLVLGRIDGRRFLGGDFQLDVDAARRAIEHDVAKPYGLSVEAAAEGILTVVNSNMSRLLREVLIERGYDPRSFTLVAFGGGGGLHACAIAEEAGVPRVVVPPHPGTLSAFGICCADVRHDAQAMFLNPAERVSSELLQTAYAQLESEARAAVRVGGSWRRTTTRSSDMRYLGQEYSLPVHTREGESAADIVERFHNEHERLYGFARRQVPVEFVKLAVSELVLTGADVEPNNGDGRGSMPNPPGARPVWGEGESQEAQVWERGASEPGTRLDGPCVIEEPGATTYVPTGWRCLVHFGGSLVIDRQARNEETA